WQQWVSENEEKQSSEPSGWAPSYAEDPKDAKKIKSLSNQDPTNKNQDGVEAAGDAGIDFLTKRICKDPETDELDKMLSKKGSPTRRRKCSNMVSELTRGWKEMEKEKKQAQEGGEDNEDWSLQLGTNQEDIVNNRTNENT
ncbi:hypothetical protein M9458_038262, partial [Cirrhinus mrigala]